MKMLGALALAVGTTGSMASSVAAHLGGEVIRPVFLTPAPSMLTAESTLRVSWNDPDSDPTGVLNFYLLAGTNVPPEAEPEAALLGGTALATVPVSDTSDVLDLDLTSVPPGVYTLHTVTTDPPLCDQVTALFATITVPDPDPTAAAPLSGLWRNPRDLLTTISGLYALRLSVFSTAEPRFTVEVGRMVPTLAGDPTDPCSARQRFEVVTTLTQDQAAAPDNEGGANLWTAKYVWKDPAALGSGSYVLRATLEAGDETLTLYSPGVLEVLASPEPQPELAEAADDLLAAELGPAELDASEGAELAEVEADLGEKAGCGVGADPNGWVTGILVLLLWGGLRSRREYERGARRRPLSGVL